MSERVIEALLQMFAVLASVRSEEDVSERRTVVYDFLTEQLNTDLANKYILVYDKYYEKNIEQTHRSDNKYKVLSRVASRVTRITLEINRELSLYQKYFVLVQLYEYLNSGTISLDEQEIVQDVVADKFNIEQDSFNQIRDFILNTEKVSERVVLTDNETETTISASQRVFWDGLKGDINFVYLPVVNMFLFKYSGGYWLEMNGTQIVSGRTYILRVGNSLRNGVCAPIFFNDMLRFVMSLDTDLVPIKVTARDVVFRFSKNAIGLHKFSFESTSGSLVGIMGVSGSGKSTFSNVISGMAEPSSGNVYINNIDIYKNPDAVKGIVGYVTQDDILLEDLTVYDNLYYNARMTFDNLSLDAIKEKIDATLQMLGLYEIKDIKVGNVLNKKISGGQRKRLNIALELMREPAILILDEPTSGLSSHDSENIIELLKDLTIKGKLIFVVIHQPSSDIFKMFDQLLVLDTGGYLIYDGNPVESINYFRTNLHLLGSRDVECRSCGNVSVEQMLDMISMNIIDEYGNNTQTRKITPKEWYDKKEAGNEADTSDANPKADPEPLPQITFKIPNRLKQLVLYFLRDVKSKMANMQYILINLFEAPLLALLLASLLRFYDKSEATTNDYVYYDNPNMPIYLVVSVIVAFFIGLTVSAEEIIQDRQINKRERFLNLSRTSYIMSKCLLTCILSAIQMFIFVVVGNSILNIKGMYGEYWLVLFSSAVSANLLGLIMSDTMKKSINIYITIPFLVIPQLILSGVFVRFDKMNPDLSSVTDVPVYGQIITTRWAFEALAVNQFVFNEYENIFYQYHKQKSQAIYFKDYWIPTLKAALDKVQKYTSQPNYDEAEVRRLLELLRNEITDPVKTFGKIAKPSPGVYDLALYGKAAYDNIADYLERVRKYHIRRFNTADEAEDKRRKKYTNQSLNELRENHANKSIEDFICARGTQLTGYLVEYENRLWQKCDLVYQDTDKSLRAQLFSPYKCVFGMRIDTYVFDVIVIWLQNLLLFGVLLSGLMPKLFKFKLSDLRRKQTGQ